MSTGNDIARLETVLASLKEPVPGWERQTVLRQPDVVGRYGGEEFVLLLPETGEEGARQVAERIRRAGARKVFRHPKGDFQVTMSCGVAIAEDSAATNGWDLLDASDMALCRAKLAGRNRTAW